MIIVGKKYLPKETSSSWNSAYVAGKIIKKIGPILAINNDEVFYNSHAVKKSLIKNSPSDIENINIRNLALDSRKVKGDLFFALKGNKLEWSFRTGFRKRC